MTLAAMVLSGRYTLDAPIGTGGYCEVWRATDTMLTRPVAVKLLHPGYARQDEALARFKAEARHAGALSHQNIARVYDYGEPANGQSYLVMELIDGPSLADVLARGPLPAERTMDIVAQAAAGLQAAHAAGLIHRDIKPANILFAPGGAVRITDFGIAHAIGSAPVTSTGIVMGTPGYIAPERVAGAQAGPASDLYALGVVAYECLAGSPPFSGGALEVAIAHRDRPLPPLPASVPAEVAAFVMMLTAKDPSWRPGGAGEVADQAGRLRDALAAAGTSRGRPAAAGRTRPEGMAPSRPRRARRALVAAALALAALACLVLVTVTGFTSAPHRAGPQAPARSPAAPALTTSSPVTASPTASQSASQPASQPPSARPSPGTDSPGPARGSATASPGHPHKKGHGHGRGDGNSQ